MNKHKIENRSLFIIIFVAVILRLGIAIFLGDTVIGDQQRRAFDQISYNSLAQSLLDNKGYSFNQAWYPFTPANTPTAHWSFLYPVYLASIYALVGYHPLAARLVQVLIVGILSSWLLFKLGSRIFYQTVGLISAGLGAVYLYFIYYDATLMTEPFFILGILAMLNLTLMLKSRQWEDRSTNYRLFARGLLEPQKLLYWIVLGIVLGITTLLRQTLLLWLPFLILWIYWEGRGQFQWWKPILTLCIMVLFILPWTIRNYFVYGEFLPLNSNAGYALYSANHPNQGTDFDGDYAAPLPPDLLDIGLNEAQWNSALMIRGLRFIWEEPLRYLHLTLDRFKGYFYFWFFKESSLASNLMRMFSFGLYLPFFIIGLILSFREWRRFSLLYLFALVYSAMHILTWASIRYRLPVDAALMPFAALAVTNIWRPISMLLKKRTGLLSNT